MMEEFTLVDTTSKEVAFLKEIKVSPDDKSARLIRFFYGFQFTIISILLSFPDIATNANILYIGLCVFVDFSRVLFVKKIRDVVLCPQHTCKNGDINFDDSYKLDYITVGFFAIYLVLPIFSYLIGNLIETKDLNAVASALNFVSYIHNGLSYGFSSGRYKEFSISFLVLLTILDFSFSALVSIRGIYIFDFRTVFGSRRLMIPGAKHPFNVPGMCSLLYVLIGFFLLLQYVLGPIQNVTFPNNFDWAGIFPMALFGLAKYGIISLFLSLNRFLMLSLQAFYYTPTVAEQQS